MLALVCQSDTVPCRRDLADTCRAAKQLSVRPLGSGPQVVHAMLFLGIVLFFFSRELAKQGHSRWRGDSDTQNIIISGCARRCSPRLIACTRFLCGCARRCSSRRIACVLDGSVHKLYCLGCCSWGASVMSMAFFPFLYKTCCVLQLRERTKHAQWVCVRDCKFTRECSRRLSSRRLSSRRLSRKCKR